MTSIVLIMRSGRLREAAARINDQFQLQHCSLESTRPGIGSHQVVVRVLYYLLNACKLFQAKRVLQRGDKYLFEGNYPRASEYYQRVETLATEGSTNLQARHNRMLCSVLQAASDGAVDAELDGFRDSFSAVFHSFEGDPLCDIRQSLTLELAALCSGLHYLAVRLRRRLQGLMARGCVRDDGVPVVCGGAPADDATLKQMLRFCSDRIDSLSRRSAGPRPPLPLQRLRDVCALLHLLGTLRLTEADALCSRFDPQDGHEVAQLLQQAQCVLQILRGQLLAASTAPAAAPRAAALVGELAPLRRRIRTNPRAPSAPQPRRRDEAPTQDDASRSCRSEGDAPQSSAPLPAAATKPLRHVRHPSARSDEDDAETAENAENEPRAVEHCSSASAQRPLLTLALPTTSTQSSLGPSPAPPLDPSPGSGTPLVVPPGLRWDDVLQRRASLRRVSDASGVDAAAPALVTEPAADDEAAPNALSLPQLLAPGPYLRGVLPHQRERYLCDADFRHALGCDRDAFYALPRWRQRLLKQRAGLF